MATPETGFESRGLTAPWTTFAEEDDYRAALEAEGITTNLLGQGEEGDDIWEYVIGSGPEHVFFMAQAHSQELAGRDALLSRVRDWFQDTAGDYTSYLADVTIHAIPTCRPDSQSTRNNANNVNVNRDHVQVTQAETQAIHRVIRDYDPSLIVDLHEGRNITTDYCATSKSLNPNTDGTILSLSDSLEKGVKSAIESAGIGWEAYQGHNIMGPEYGHNFAGIKHAVGLLVESHRDTGDSSDADHRYNIHITAIDAIIDWHSTRVSEVSSAQSNSQDAAVTLSSVELVVSTNSSGPVISPAPDGYAITSADESTLATAEDLHGLLITTDEGGLLDARDPSRVIAHYLADTESEQRLVDGSRFYEVPPPSNLAGMRPLPGLRFRTGGRTYDAAITPVMPPGSA